LVDRHLVRADEHAPVALALCDQREPHPGVAGRGLDDRPAGLQLTARLRGLDHLQCDPVLDRAPRVHVLDLREDRRRQPLGHRAQPDERGVPDELADVLRISHGLTVSTRQRWGTTTGPSSVTLTSKRSGCAPESGTKYRTWTFAIRAGGISTG